MTESRQPAHAPLRFRLVHRLVDAIGTSADDEEHALVLARSLVGPRNDHVSITASVPTDVGGVWPDCSFAIRYLLWEGDHVRDTGWRLWRRGEFIGGGALDELLTALEVAHVA